jgi:hypothetical protein
MTHADIHIVVPTEMHEALASFQSTPKLASQNSTNDFTDTVQRQGAVVLKIARLRSRIFKPRDSHREQATLAEKAQRRLDVCLLDTLVFVGREQGDALATISAPLLPRFSLSHYSLPTIHFPLSLILCFHILTNCFSRNPLF